MSFGPTLFSQNYSEDPLGGSFLSVSVSLCLSVSLNIYFIFLTAWWLLFAKKILETQGSQSKFHELNIYI